MKKATELPKVTVFTEITTELTKKALICTGLVTAIIGLSSVSGALAQANDIAKHTRTAVPLKCADEALRLSLSMRSQQTVFSEMIVGTLTEEQISLFKDISLMNVFEIKKGKITLEEGEKAQEGLIDVYIMVGELPENGKSLYMQWKNSTGYYEQFNGLDVRHEDTKQEKQEEIEINKPVVEVPNEVKPQPSIEQQIQVTTPTPSPTPAPTPTPEPTPTPTPEPTPAPSNNASENSQGTTKWGGFETEAELRAWEEKSGCIRVDLNDPNSGSGHKLSDIWD